MNEWPAFDPEEWLSELLADSEPVGARQRGYASGGFVCPGCSGTADVIVAEVVTETANQSTTMLRPPAVPVWHEPWQAHVTIELVCQGPHNLDAQDHSAWDHAGETIDLIATGYQPSRLN